MSLWNCTPGLYTDVDAEFGIFENMPGRTGKCCKIWLVFSHADNTFNANPFTAPLNLYINADLDFFLHQFHTSYKKKKKITPGSSVNLNVS